MDECVIWDHTRTQACMHPASKGCNQHSTIKTFLFCSQLIMADAWDRSF
jgi:hypothetical protein